MPTSSDDVFFDAASGAASISYGALYTAHCRDLTLTGFTGSFTAGSGVLSIERNVTLSGKALTAADINLNGTNAVISSGGGTFTTPDVMTIVAGVSLSDDLTVVGLLELSAGTFATNNHNVTCTRFRCGGANAATITMGSGTWTMTGADNGANSEAWCIGITSVPLITITPGTSTVKFTDATSSTKTFRGGSYTYNNVWFSGAGTGTFVIRDSNTFADLKIDTPPHTLKFEPGVTTVTTLTTSGSASAFMTLQSNVPGTAWDIIGAAGASITYAIISDSHAHGGTFLDTSGADAGGNRGWTFTSSFNTQAAADGYFDSFYVYSGSSVSVVEGVNWLIGETVGVLSNGVDIGDAVVSPAGKVTLPGSNSGAVVIVGKRYTSRGVTLRAPQAGNQDGSALGRAKVISEVFVDMLDSAGIEAGTLESTRPIPPEWKQSADGTLYTGVYKAPILDKHRNDGVFVFETDKGYPAIIRAIQFALDSEP